MDELEVLRQQINLPQLTQNLSKYLDFLQIVQTHDNYNKQWTSRMVKTGTELFSLPAWESERGNLTHEWIENSLQQYTKWFLSFKDKDEVSDVIITSSNSFAIYFMWQTHLLHPIDYAHDCHKILGKLLVPKQFQFQNEDQDQDLVSNFEFLDEDKPLSIKQKEHFKIEPGFTVKDYEVTYKHSSKSLLTKLMEKCFGPYVIDNSNYKCYKELFSVRDFSGSAWKQIVFSRKILGRRNIAEIRHQFVQKTMVQRYLQFLLLIKKFIGEGKLFTPTLDIDLVWHAHQLNPQCYGNDCRWLVGQLINHDDNPPSDQMSIGNNFTCDKWYQTYGKRIMIKHFLDQSVICQHSNSPHYQGGFFNFSACGTFDYYNDPCECA